MRASLAALLATAALLALPVAALAACPQTTVGDLEDEVQCLECGVPLALATESPQANRQRALIGRLVDSCRSKDDIKDALVAEFGPRVLTTPEDDGFGLAAWLVPVLALVLAGGAIALAVRRWRGRSPDRPTTAPAGQGGVAGRLERDLDRYDL
jgi:cytochrome c-type biogenesis protein CcmH